MGQSLRISSEFGEAFGLHRALQLAVSTAFRAGTPVRPEALAEMLAGEFPEAGMSEAEIRGAVVKACRTAGVLIEHSPQPGLPDSAAYASGAM
jgi:hypothetical protein